MLFHNGWKETADTDTIASHDDWDCTTIFIQDIRSHTCWVTSPKFENVTNLDTTCKVEHTLAIWWNFTLTYFTDIYIFSNEISTWVDTRQVVAILVGTNNSITAILYLAVCDNLDIFWKIDWTKWTKVRPQQFFHFCLSCRFQEICSKIVFQFDFVELVIAHE